MKHLLPISASLFFALAPPGFAQSSVQPLPEPVLHAEIVSLGICKPLTYSDHDFLPDYKEGVSVNILLTLPPYHVLGYYSKLSELILFADDRGNDLTKSMRSRDGSIDYDAYGTFESPISASEGTGKSQSLGIVIHSKDLPTPGATKLRLHARLTAVYGTKPKTAVLSHVRLLLGSSLQIGSVHMKVESIEYDKEKKGWNYGFSSGHDLRQIIDMGFYDAHGTSIATYDSAVMDDTGDLETYHSYFFKTKPTWVNVKASYYESIKNASVDLNQEIGIGL